MTVNIQPLPAWMRKITPKFRPLHPPVFPDGEPTQAEVKLALAMLDALDDESRHWYGEPLIERIRSRL